MKLSCECFQGFIKNYQKRECIPVGCVPPACCPYLPACTAPGGCTCLGGVPGPGAVPCLGGVPGQGVHLVQGGVPGLGGVPGPRGLYLPRGVPSQVPPSVNRMTNRCKNITLSQTSLAGGNETNINISKFHLLKAM